MLLTNTSIDNPKFLHIRNVSPEDKISSKGGLTIAYYLENNNIRYAEAHCHPKDTFCKRLGRVKAAGRLKSNTLSNWCIPTSQTPKEAEQEFINIFYSY